MISVDCCGAAAKGNAPQKRRKIANLRNGDVPSKRVMGSEMSASMERSYDTGWSNGRQLDGRSSRTRADGLSVLGLGKRLLVLGFGEEQGGMHLWRGTPGLWKD